MKRVVLTFGIISGIVSAGLMLSFIPFIDKIGFDKGFILGYSAIVLSFLLVFFGIRSYRENVGGGQISFGKAYSQIQRYCRPRPAIYMFISDCTQSDTLS